MNQGESRWPALAIRSPTQAPVSLQPYVVWLQAGSPQTWGSDPCVRAGQKSRGG